MKKMCIFASELHPDISTNYITMKTRHKNKLKKMMLLMVVLACGMTASAQWNDGRLPTRNRAWRQKMNETNPDFFKTDEARRIGQQIMLWQRCTGGWPKNIDMVTLMTDEQKRQVAADKLRTDDSTIDNGATTQQMRFLARLYQQTGDKATAEAFHRGVAVGRSSGLIHRAIRSISPSTTMLSTTQWRCCAIWLSRECPSRGN